MSLNELETPVPVVDLAKVDANLKRMQDYCDTHGIKLWPHIKTHKIVEMAKRQLALGAEGLVCQKLTEAEVMLDAGCENILISYPMIGMEKARRLAAIAGKAKFTVAADSICAVDTLREAAEMSGAEIGVLVEFDSGMGRTGVVTPKEAYELAEMISDTDGLRFAGLMTYPSNENSVAFLKEVKPLLDAAGFGLPVFSGGGTPKAFHQHELGIVDQLRVGTYIYHDRNTVAAGAASLEDCALHVLATVISTPKPGHFVLDCGTKTLTSDPVAAPNKGHGLLVDYPEAVIERLTEEHGMVTLDPDLPAPRIGEKVLILPNHVCPVSNLHDQVAVRQRDGSFEFWDVSARGCTR
ncbi:alanine racemase [Psychromarinibacter halotolerans]|uniref:Alanine racemase n=1 Tax=Psychromarinibacter halotolerans TaxID=1775175 RepID=A0ABV7GNH9_9RHOB|nr:alanine racemase [Psychromarinibacter halotolerans]MDF0597906.1 alanine racemase [Psychromarinibacter halotolerans]